METITTDNITSTNVATGTKSDVSNPASNNRLPRRALLSFRSGQGQDATTASVRSGNSTTISTVTTTTTIGDDRSSVEDESKHEIYSMDNTDSSRGGNDMFSHSSNQYKGPDNSSSNGGGIDEDDIDDASSSWNKLDFLHSGFVGRDDELEKLRSIYGRLCRKQSVTSSPDTEVSKEMQVVLVHGHSGTGKSALVEAFVRPLLTKAKQPKAADTEQEDETNDDEAQPTSISKPTPTATASATMTTTATTPSTEQATPKPATQSIAKPCYLCKGKYDQFNVGGTLSAVTEAFSEFFLQLANSDEPSDIKECERIATAICEKLDATRRKLSYRIIPGLAKLMSKVDPDGTNRAAVGYDFGTRNTNRSSIHGSLKHSDGDAGPLASSVTGSQTTEMTVEESLESLTSHDAGFQQIVFGFKVIIKVVSTTTQPVVLYLDDLQWADDASLKLIADILVDTSIQNLLLIGSYRSNEVNDDDRHPLNIMLKEWKQTEAQRIHEIPLNDFTKEQVAQYIANGLKLDVNRKVNELATTLHNKTKGNVLYVMQSLEELHRKQILARNIHTMQWDWDHERAAKDLDLAANVIDLITSKLHSLPQDVQTCLMMASFLRSMFNQSVLEILLEKEAEWHRSNITAADGLDHGGNATEAGDLESILETATKEGLLQKVGPARTQAQTQAPQEGMALADADKKKPIDIGTRPSSEAAAAATPCVYRFVHDRIQQAAHAMAPKGKELECLRHRLGKALMELTSHPILGESWMVFVAADQFESMPVMLPPVEVVSPLDLVHLNLTAGQMAVSVSAFVHASKYLNRALQMIETMVHDAWETQHDLCLEVYKTLAKVELSLGYHDRGSALCKTVLSKSTSAADVISTKIALAYSLNRISRYNEALVFLFESIRTMYKFPRRNHLALAFWDIRYIRKHLDKHTDDEILSKSTMTDEKLKFVMALILLSIECSYQAQQHGTTILLITRLVRLTFKHGLIAHGAHGCLALGSFSMNNLGDPERGKRLSIIGQKMMKATPSKDLVAAFNVVLTIFVTVWWEPLHVALLTLKDGQRAGMETGMLDSAYKNWGSTIVLRFLYGLPLGPIQNTSWKYVQQLRHYNLTAIASAHDHIHYTIEYLLRDYDDSHPWITVVVPPLDQIDGSEYFTWMYFYWSRIQLATYFGQLEQGKTYIKPLYAVTKLEVTYMMESTKIYHSGLICSRLARQYRQQNQQRRHRKYLRRARQFLAQMKYCIEAKGGNNLHRFLLMEADIEAASSSRSIDIAKAAYNKAISCSARSGHIHDTALAYELAGEYFMSAPTVVNPRSPGASHEDATDNAFWSRQYLSNALSLYDEWGATAKVQQMRATYPQDQFIVTSEGTNGGRQPGQARHTTDARMCIETAHKMFAEINLDVL